MISSTHLSVKSPYPAAYSVTQESPPDKVSFCLFSMCATVIKMKMATTDTDT